jgi:putative ATP-dependent endonuclease of the OLD family
VPWQQIRQYQGGGVCYTISLHSPLKPENEAHDGGLMFLRRIDVKGYRAASERTLTCEFTGAFNLLIGANSSGKTTINEAILHAHRHRFPQLGAVDAAALGPPPRAVSVAYSFNDGQETEGALGQALLRSGKPAPSWSRPLERALGRVRAGAPVNPTDGFDRIRLIYLPALRNPVDELSRRDTRV